MPRTQENIKEKIRVKQPDLYDVVFHNDDFTTMDFVVMVLMEVFYLSGQDANTVMLNVHRHGKGVAGTYTWDIAVSKAEKVKAMAREQGFPLRLSITKH